MNSRTKLTIYRRHAASCGQKDSPKLEACECPLWIHGKVRGKFIRQSLDTRSLAAAAVKRDELLRGGDDDPTPGGGVRAIDAKKKTLTVEDAQKDFLKSKAGRSASTKSLYGTTVDHFRRFVEAQGITLLRDVDRTHVQAYFAEYASAWKRNTAQGRLTHLRVFFNYAVRERRWLDHSPAASRDLNFTKKGKTTKGTAERMPFQPEEVTRIIAAVDQLPEGERERARALVLLLLYTGMRISDAAFFERASVDADNLCRYWIIKTRKQLDCSLELAPQLVDALAQLPTSRVYFFQPDVADDYREARHALRTGGEFAEHMPGYTLRVAAVTRLVLKVLRLAGLKEVRPRDRKPGDTITPGACHRFRDTFAVSMLLGGEDLYTVCQFLGHSDVRITQAHYMKFVPGYLERFAQRTRALRYHFPLAG